MRSSALGTVAAEKTARSSAPHQSQWNRLPFDFPASGLRAAVDDSVDREPREPLNVIHEECKIEEIDTFIWSDEKIDVTVETVLPTRHRAKDSYVA